MKFKKRKVIFEKNEDFNIEKDKADVYTVQANQIICNNNSLFCNTKRFWIKLLFILILYFITILTYPLHKYHGI